MCIVVALGQLQWTEKENRRKIIKDASKEILIGAKMSSYFRRPHFPEKSSRSEIQSTIVNQTLIIYHHRPLPPRLLHRRRRHHRRIRNN